MSEIKQTINWNNLVIEIEWLKGEVRFPEVAEPKALAASYGRIKDTLTRIDNEEIDVYIGDYLETSPNIFRLTQVTDQDIELKWGIGFNTADEFRSAYCASMPSDFIADLQTSSLDELKKYLLPNILLADLFKQYLLSQTWDILGLSALVGTNTISTFESLDTINNLIEISLRAISDRCDGGLSIDGKGFRPGDSILVSRLLSKSMAEWSNDEETKAINLLYRYRKQLKDFGIDYAALVPKIESNNDLEVVLDQAASEINQEEKAEENAKEKNLSEVGNRETITETFTTRVLESIDGLPSLVQAEGPAEAISRNHIINEKGEKIHREWKFADFQKGERNTNSIFISKEIYPHVQYSHPDDDPEETGLEPIGQLVYMETFPETKRLKFNVRIYPKSTNGQKLAERYKRAEQGLEDYPAFSIRTRPSCEDEINMMGRCTPLDGMPLLVDFLRPHEMPGIEGSKGSAILENQTNPSISESSPKANELSFRVTSEAQSALSVSECQPDKCCSNKEVKDKCKKCKETVRSKPIQQKRSIRVLENLTNSNNIIKSKNKFSLAGKGINSGVIYRKNSKGVECMSKNMLAVLDKIAAAETPEIRQAMADTAKMLAADDMEMDMDMENPVEADAIVVDPNVEDPNKAKDAAKMDEKAYEKLLKQKGIGGLIKSITTEVVKTLKPAIVATETVKPSISEDQVLEVLGMTREERDADKVAREAAKAQKTTESQLRAAFKTAMETKANFCGHNISDVTKYPETAIESAMQAACLEGSYDKAISYLKAELKSVAEKAQTTESTSTNNGYLDNQYQVQHDIRVTEGYREVKKKIEEVKAIFIGQMKDSNPEAYKRYEYNQGLPEVQRSADKALEVCVKTYGVKPILAFDNKKAWAAAKEDVNVNGFTNMPNYAAVMTALMVVRQWRKSPVWDLVGSAPGVAVKAVGNPITSGNGVSGQFVEISSETRSQRRDFDAQYIQSATDPQPEISLYQQPHQYFAYQESSRIRWTTELEAFMRMDPYKRDEAARAVVNLMEELDLFTEQRISTEIMRASDAYKCATITNETTNIAQTACWSYTGGTSGITLPDGTVVLNGIGWVWMRRGYASGTTTPVYGPIVRPGTDPTLNRATLTFPATYPVNINAINGKTQVRGMYNSVTQLGEKINASSADPTFIVFPDIGICVFLIGSLFDATHMPTFSQYSTVANVLRFDFTASSGETRAAIADRYVEAVSSMNSTFSMRQTNDNVRKFLLTSNPILQNVVAFSSYVKPLTELPYARIEPTFRNNGNGKVMSVLDVDYMGTSEPLYNTNYRSILGTPGGTVYEELMAPVLGGLDQGGLIDQNGNLAYNSTQSRSVTRRAVVATVYPRNQNDIQENFGLAGMYHVAFPQTSGLPL